jgi:hypothetical protein
MSPEEIARARRLLVELSAPGTLRDLMGRVLDALEAANDGRAFYRKQFDHERAEVTRLAAEVERLKATPPQPADRGVCGSCHCHLGGGGQRDISGPFADAPQMAKCYCDCHGVARTAQGTETVCQCERGQACRSRYCRSRPFLTAPPSGNCLQCEATPGQCVYHRPPG